MTKEEAIEVYHGLLNQKIKEAFEVFAPELKESEDERIRKAIVTLIKDLQHYSTNYAGVDPTEMLAWLEKQKEQKSISAEAVLVKAGLQPYKDGNQWCILAGANIQESICGFGDTIEDALYEFLKEVLDLQKGRQPAEWNEEDEKMRDYIIHALTNNTHAKEQGPVLYAKEIAWLKSLKDRGNFPKSNTNSPSEWSEEDTEMYINVASSLRGYACGLENEEHKKHIKKGLDWLENRFKCLRPQSHWKPSEEQMIAFRNYIDSNRAKAEASVGGWNNYDAMIRLFEDLKNYKI